jgi:hypothetical protein
LGGWVDKRGNIWVQGALSFIIPIIPLAWMAARAPWQVIIINAIAGILWTGYSLASFNLLLDMAPENALAEANALFQLVVAGSWPTPSATGLSSYSALRYAFWAPWRFYGGLQGQPRGAPGSLPLGSNAA